MVARADMLMQLSDYIDLVEPVESNRPYLSL